MPGPANVRPRAAVAWLKCAAVTQAITAGREASVAVRRSWRAAGVRKQVSQNIAQPVPVVNEHAALAARPAGGERRVAVEQVAVGVDRLEVRVHAAARVRRASVTISSKLAIRSVLVMHRQLAQAVRPGRSMSTPDSRSRCQGERSIALRTSSRSRCGPMRGQPIGGPVESLDQPRRERHRVGPCRCLSVRSRSSWSPWCGRAVVIRYLEHRRQAGGSRSSVPTRIRY